MAKLLSRATRQSKSNRDAVNPHFERYKEPWSGVSPAWLAREEARSLDRSYRLLISGVTAFSVAVAQMPAAVVAAELSRADYENCQARDEAGFKAALAAISTDALKAGVKNVDYRAVVADQWRKSGLDDVIDKRVDFAIDEVKAETSWTERLKSLANAEASQKLATAVAERVYRSDAVKVAMEDLAAGVAKDIGKTIEFASTEASEPVLACLKAFVGPRYGSAVAQA
ncbi:MAG: hypothetical protein ABL897_08675, partial [Hyphomicrobium sp.]